MEIGFNVNYLLDALAAVDSEQVEFGCHRRESSCLIREPAATAQVRRHADAPLSAGSCERAAACRCSRVRSHWPSAVLGRRRARRCSPAATIYRRRTAPARRASWRRSFCSAAGRSFRTRQIRRARSAWQPTASPCTAKSMRASALGALGVAFASARLEKKIDGDAAAERGGLAATVPGARARSGHARADQGGPQRAPPVPRLGSVPRGTRLPRRVAPVSSCARAAERRAQSRALDRELSTGPWRLIEAGDASRCAPRTTMSLDWLQRSCGVGTRLLGIGRRAWLPCGWADEPPFAAALPSRRRAIARSAIREVGPHRADLEVMLDGRRAPGRGFARPAEARGRSLVLARSIYRDRPRTPARCSSTTRRPSSTPARSSGC